MNGYRLPVLINGQTYGWAQLTVCIAGVLEPGITEINYESVQAIEKQYGIGQKPIGRGYGNITEKADITLTRRAVEAMRAASPTGRLQDIPEFDIIVCYVPLAGGKIVTHRIKGCVIENDANSAKQGDPNNELKLILNVMEIQYV